MDVDNCSTNRLLFIHSLWQVINLNQQSTEKTVHMCAHIIMYNCCTQHSTEQLQ